jgi:hypothetical protein
MPTPVAPYPTASRLLATAVDEPVSSAHGRRRAQHLNFLRAHLAQSVAVARFGPTTTNFLGLGGWVHFFYRRTPGIQAVRLGVKLHPAQSGGSSKTAVLAVDVGTAPGSMSPATILSASDSFGGVESVTLPDAKVRVRDELVAFLDVRALDPANVYLVRVSYTPAVANEANFFSRVSLHEVPLAAVDPSGDPTNEPGVNEAEADVRNRVHQGTTGGPTGLLRLFGEYDVARTKVRAHAQISTPQGYSWNGASGGLAALNWGVGGYDPRLRGRARRRYAAGTYNRYTVCALYGFAPTYAGVAACKLRVSAATPAGTDGTFADVALVDTAGGYAVGTATLDVTTADADQRFELAVTAATESTDGVSFATDTVRLHALALIEDES